MELLFKGSRHVRGHGHRQKFSLFRIQGQLSGKISNFLKSSKIAVFRLSMKMSTRNLLQVAKFPRSGQTLNTRTIRSCHLRLAKIFGFLAPKAALKINFFSIRVNSAYNRAHSLPKIQSTAAGFDAPTG